MALLCVDVYSEEDLYLISCSEKSDCVHCSMQRPINLYGCMFNDLLLIVLFGREASTKAYLGSAHSSCYRGSKGCPVPSYRNCTWSFFQ